MPRASRASNPPAPAAAAMNVSSNAGLSDPSCSATSCQLFRPVTRSMTSVSTAITASPDFKEGGYASTSNSKSISDASFSIQLAASRPTVTQARTAQKATSSGWKPFTQPAALSEGQKCATLATINPTAKRLRVAPSRVSENSMNHSDSSANSNFAIGKRNIDEECMMDNQLDEAVFPSPSKKLQTCKAPSDVHLIRKSTIKILGGKEANSLSTGKSQTETGKSSSVPAELVSASTNDTNCSADVTDPFLSQQLQPDTAKNPNVITEAFTNEKSPINQLAPTVVTLPRQNLQTDYEHKPPIVPIATNQMGELAGATAPMVWPKLEIGKVKDTGNAVLNRDCAWALMVKQQEQLLKQFSLGSSQQQQFSIKGPALFENDEPPPTEPLGTRCMLCKLDVTFRAQGDAGTDASAPPVVAVLACHHAFHSSCIESVYGLAEPDQCVACLEAGAVRTDQLPET